MASSGPPPSSSEMTALERVHLPRVAIKFCTQCRWMLRAAYRNPLEKTLQFAQELLSTFGTDLGEVALVPVTGGVFTITIWHAVDADTSASNQSNLAMTQETLLWDRKTDGGFPEVKVLKSRVRNVIAPNRDLGHTDRALRKEEAQKKNDEEQVPGQRHQGDKKKDCEDCV
ncbi:hypothetical protein N7539_005708 [Penicillium diatomitis]|uniref:Selenoprotein W-like protein n=1 Tax=Penicillium diatomitis TaxID=2819901 RepID=A0A9W9X4R0_9EURO|nr:uncharacterized protein N7539_005708 [Penicillium diatomitis]KAJ5483912.1 hypothetical protein N7539_005708 [Penicillium diatomitis]